jgi:hypothetical protein
VTLFGIDVSKWQTRTPHLDTVQFLFARASIGTTRDTMYPVHIGNAKVAGIVTGAYHFNWDTISIAAQVTTFIDAAGSVDLYALDVEGEHAFSQAQSKEFIRLMHEAGLKCGLYHSASGFFDAGQDFDWVAKWSATPPGSWDFWQFTSDGQLPGYTGRLDFDRFNGTLAELHALAGMAGPDTGTGGSMKLTDVTAKPGRVRMNADGPVWRVADGVQVQINAGAEWDCVGTARYNQTPADPDGAGGYMIRARAADGELHIVSVTRVTFTPPPETDCKAEIAADRKRAYVAYKA